MFSFVFAFSIHHFRLSFFSAFLPSLPFSLTLALYLSFARVFCFYLSLFAPFIVLLQFSLLCLFAIDIHRFLPPFFLPFIHHRTTHVLLNEPFLSPFSWDLETVNFAYFTTKRTFHHIFSGHKISKVRVGYII